jgi:hypothetical protein
MGDEVASADRIAEDSSKALGVPVSVIHFTAIEDSFAWLKVGEIIWARTEDFKAAVYWVRQGASPKRLNGPDGLQNVSALLTSQPGPLPGCVSTIQLAEAVRKLTVEPRGFVGNRDFLARASQDMESWLIDGAAKDRELFKQHCRDPRLSPGSGDEWILEFYYFNPEGGVESWRVSGDKKRIATARKSEALANGTFRWPFK